MILDLRFAGFELICTMKGNRKKKNFLYIKRVYNSLLSKKNNLFVASTARWKYEGKNIGSTHDEYNSLKSLII